MPAIRSTDATPIAYELSGSGPPLVLVHGTSADHTRWAPVLPALEKHFTVYAVDRRGRGGSGDAPNYAIEREFEDIAAVVDSIGQPVDLLGHSYGAICSLEAALLTSNIRRLISYEPPIKTSAMDLYPVAVVAEMQGLLEAGDRDAAVGLFFRAIARVSPHEIEVLRSAPSWAGRLAAAHTILREMCFSNTYTFEAARFANWVTPTLLLLGGHSGPLFRDAIELLSRTLTTSRVVEMPGQEHAAMNTAPELFVRQVTEFLLLPR